MDTIAPFEFIRLKQLANDLLHEEKYLIRDTEWREKLVEDLAVHCLALSKGDEKFVKEQMWKIIPQFLKSPDLMAKPIRFN